MKQLIRSNITIKASSIHECNSTGEYNTIHDCNNTSEHSTIHEHTTTPPRIFRPLFQTKDSPSLGRRSSGLMSFIVVIFLAILVSIASSNNTFATTSTLSLSVNDIISLNLASADNGVLSGSTSTTNTTISVNTTNATGYTLSIAASTGTANTPAPLNNVDTNCTTNCTIPSITTATSTSDTSSLTTGTWGYLPSKFNSAVNTVYRPAPTVEGDILDITNTANASSNSSDNNNYNIAIGARLDYATATPGTYSSAFIVTAVANATPYTITYNANGGSDTVTNMPANVTNDSTYAETVPLSGNTPVRDGYNFIGWCTVQTTDGQACSDVSGTSFAPGDNWTIDQTSSTNALTLYAVWEPSSYTVTVNFAGSGVSSVSFTNATYGNANTVSSTGGTTSLKHGVPYTITMNFSSSSYTIDSWATTANGTLNSTTANPTTYTVTNTATLTATGKTNKLYFQNATSANCGSTMYDNRGVTAYRNVAYTTAKIGSLCWMTRNLDLPGGTTIYKTDSNITADSYTLPASSTSGFYITNTAYVYNSDSTNFNDTSCGDNNPCYSYYSYVAAMAGTNPYSGNASSDICPKGWRLPTEAELTTLKNSYNTGAKITASPFLGVYAGQYDDSSLKLGGSSGYYWSSTANTTSYAYFLYFYSTYADVTNRYNSYGNSVRCVAKS